MFGNSKYDCYNVFRGVTEFPKMSHYLKEKKKTNKIFQQPLIVVIVTLYALHIFWSTHSNNISFTSRGCGSSQTLNTFVLSMCLKPFHVDCKLFNACRMSP